MDSHDVLRDFIMKDLQWPGKREQLSADFPLIEREVLDSLGLFSLVSFVETHFGVEIFDEELVPENFGTIHAVAQLIERKRAAAGG
jgi:acyl carrier protein